MVIIAGLIVVMCGMAGLSIDLSHDYLVRRGAQNAADMAALAAGKQLALTGAMLTAPPKSGDASVVASHDMATNNGVSTIYNTGCDVATSTSFSATWFDVAGLPCSATSGYTWKVVVSAPAVTIAGYPTPPSQCFGNTRFNCFQVTVYTRITHWFMGAFGIPTASTLATATVYAEPASNTAGFPPGIGVYLYEPSGAACGAALSCFDESRAPGRTQMSCDPKATASNNCPTFWSQAGTKPLLAGVNGVIASPAQDYVAVESNGDMVLQDQTTFCDPYNTGACTQNAATGNRGFALNGGKIYCSGFGAGTPGTYANCTTTGQPTLNKVFGNESYFDSATWSPNINTSGLPSCGGLVLNGNSVSSALSGAPAACLPPASEPYSIQPGIYTYIVINHGTYEFTTGIYDITGKAPVNTATGAGYTANGIDHSLETTTDFDLCTAGTANGCPGLTAGVWIGHGGGSYSAYVAGTASSCLGGAGSSGTVGGGGDPTNITGTGVTFRLESGSGGFVATHEASTSLAAPGPGAQPADAGVPILLDLENDSFIHLDGSTVHHEDSSPSASKYIGLVYQYSNAKAGGVELDPGLAGTGNAALSGQILAYSLTTFGTSGTAVDFTNAYGSAGSPVIATSGKNESEVITSSSLSAAGSGYESFVVKYNDEWALDAYDVYIKINSGAPTFFSQGIWSPVPAANQPQPPPNNNPGDNYPAYPNTASPGSYTTAADPVTGKNTDWTLSLSNGGKFEVSGNWTWGHESDITGASSGTNVATITYTFPIPQGQAVTITTFLTDGDHCGDYALSTVTFNNVGQPFGGTQTMGSVRLVQ